MMTTDQQKLSLDRPAVYQIKVWGFLDRRWPDWYDQIKVTVKSGDNGFSVTTLTGTFDQAGLIGLLRRLYSLGLPLISVICLDV